MNNSTIYNKVQLIEGEIMDKDIQSIMNSKDFDKFRNLSRADLEFLRMIFALHLFRYSENDDKRVFSIVKMCSMEDYSFLTYLANMEYDIQVKKSSLRSRKMLNSNKTYDREHAASCHCR